MESFGPRAPLSRLIFGDWKPERKLRLAINRQECYFLTNYFEICEAKIKSSIVVNMRLLDPPSEVFHSIIEAYVVSTCYECDLKNLQLVNSKYFV